MIDESLKKTPAKKRGRPPGKNKGPTQKAPAMEEATQPMDNLAAEGTKRAEQFMEAAASGEGPFIFKSKYREDVVWLETPREEKRPDGSRFVSPGDKVEFHRNTATISDPLRAQKLREKIEERRDNNPMHIVETTPS